MKRFDLEQAKVMKALFAGMVIVSAVMGAPTLAAERTHLGATSDHGRWICDSYGRSGGRGTWQMVSGEQRAELEAAVNSAMGACWHRGLTSCQRNACWEQ